MTTGRKPYSGRGQNESKDLDGYMKKSKAASFGNFMRTFSRTKTSGLITAWDDAHFMTVMNKYFKFLDDASGAVDSATVGSAGFLVLLDVAWETHFKNANLKDLVATDEAAWKLYFCAMAQICLDMQIQYNLRCYLPAYTENDAVPGSSSAITFLSQSSYDIFSASMKDLPVPKGIYDLVDLFCTWVVPLTQEYERYTLRIPSAIFQPFNCLFDLEDFQAMRGLCRANLGGMITHANKYGLGTSAWRDPIKPVEKPITDPDVIAYFNHAQFRYYNNAPAAVTIIPNGGFGGANLTTEYTLVEYAFKDTPNESKIHGYAPWFGTYNATNNPYGGYILDVAPNTAEYYINMLFCAQHATSMAQANLGDAILTDLILSLFKAGSDNEDAEFKLEFNGTNFTAVKGLDDVWPLAYFNRVFYGKNRGAIETNDDLLNLFGRSLI